jgi:hypothetical protein
VKVNPSPDPITPAPGEPEPSASGTNSILERFDAKWPILIIFVVCLVWAAFMTSVGWNHKLADPHAFRQTQTAITSYYLVRGGPLLGYETPVLGYPWSVPFEFPLYQWIVATIVRVFPIQLDQAGRLISEIFFVLSLATMWFLLTELGVRPVYSLVLITLTLVSPQYIFWSRSFMIESTALFFCLAYLCFMVRYIRTRKTLDLCLGGLFGVVGALVKATTFPPFALVGVIFYVLSLRRKTPHVAKFPRALMPHVLSTLFFLILPVLITGVWVQYTDQIKAFNVIGRHMTSATLQAWNFGLLSQRFLGSTWQTLLSQTIPDLVGNPLILLLPFLSLPFARHRALPFLISVVGFLSAFLLFTNLHVIHNYYAYANGIFLVAAISWCIVGLLEGKWWHRLLGLMLFLICVVNSIAAYNQRYYFVQKFGDSDITNVARAIKNVTQPKDVILVFGRDWSSDIPYYSERRAIVWPGWTWLEPELGEAIGNLGSNRIAAVILCNGTEQDAQLVQRVAGLVGNMNKPSFRDPVCAVYPSAIPTSSAPPKATAPNSSANAPHN